MKLKRPKKFHKPAQCEHIKTNGLRCGSPALKERKYCFFHQRARELHRMRRARPDAKLRIPLLEDANSIQMAIQEVADAIAEDRIDSRRAGLLLFAFQTAACNLKNTDFEPQKLREDLEDPDQMGPIARFLMEEFGLFEEDQPATSAAAATNAPTAPQSPDVKLPPAPALAPEVPQPVATTG